MAVSPYVSRAELWLANSSFRPTFHLPNDFHPSVFLKWFPGHMAKGLLLSAVEIIFDNTEETISKWQLIHCWCICYSFTYDATPITKMRLCNRSSWCENILFSAKICIIKVKRLYANLLSRAFIQHLNPPPPTPQHPPSSLSQLLGGGDNVLETRLTVLKYYVWSPVCSGVSKQYFFALFKTWGYNKEQYSNCHKRCTLTKLKDL